MTDPVTRQPPEVQRRNFRLGVLNGAIYQMGEGFADSVTVIPLFLSRLGANNALIGFMSGLADMGWLLPQLFVAPLAARLPRQVVLYRGAAIVRGAALALFAALIWPLRDHSGLLLAAFVACYTLYCMGAGFGGVAFMEIVARTIPARRLGSYWSLRLFWGGTLGAVSGLLVREILKLETQPLAFAILFGLAAILASLAYTLFASVQEPEMPPARSTGSPLTLLRAGLAQFAREPRFRRLLISRASLSVWITASPFIVLFAARDLGGGIRAAGTFLLARVLGYVLANLVWHPLSRKRGTRAVMCAATLLASLAALGACGVAVASPWGLRWMSASAAVFALELMVFLGGAAQSGMLVGYASLVLELAPREGRQSFVALANTLVAPTLLLPLLGGALVDWINAPVVFGLCGVAGLVGFRAALGLRAGATDVDERAAAELVTGDEV